MIVLADIADALRLVAVVILLVVFPLLGIGLGLWWIFWRWHRERH